MTQSLKIAFHTLGCKLNFAETSGIARGFVQNGRFIPVKFSEEADIYVINSCSVTRNAEKKCRELIRRIKKQTRGARIVVMGCYSQLKPGELYDNEGVDIVLGNNDKYTLFDYLERFRETGIIEKPGYDKGLDAFVPSWSGEDRTRTFLKIQDGCDYGCTYCTVPRARGRSRSDNIANTIETIKTLSGKHVKELVLTGVNIGDFGKQHNETLLGLLQEIEKNDLVDRIRLSSVEPDLLDDEIIHLIARSKKIMPHFHLPLQSGSDKVLRDMRRKYDIGLFSLKVNKIKELMPSACIAVDVIAGFPTETQPDFLDTIKYIEGLNVSYLHVFTYSERENTPAAKYDSCVSSYDKKLRSKQLKDLSGEKLKNFYKMNSGTETTVLFEKKITGDFISGFTPNYIRVKTPYVSGLENKIKKVVLTGFDENNQFMCKIL